jgi:hypothetical protein
LAYNSERNEPLGGSILLHDGSYTVPRELEESKARKIIEDQAEDYGHELRDSTMPYFSISLGNGERYDLIYLPTRNGLQAVAHYSEEDGETLDFQKIEDILEGETQNYD